MKPVFSLGDSKDLLSDFDEIRFLIWMELRKLLMCLVGLAGPE